MSKQLYMYALPEDIQRIIAMLSEKLGVLMISPTSPRSAPTWIDSPIQNHSLLQSEGATSAKCCLVSGGLAKLRFKYFAKLGAWHVTDDSEIIVISGCDFDGKTLGRGRFYCQTDVLSGSEIIPKNLEFVRWADKVFRHVRMHLQRSSRFDAYIGRDAWAWEEAGGHFASLVLPDRIIPAVSKK